MTAIANNKNFYMCDFETTSTLNYEREGVVRVWAWCVLDINTCRVIAQGTDIKTFIDFLLKTGQANYYFHNLRFDGSFIVDYLLKEGYTYTTEKLNLGEFKTVIDDMGLWYNITIATKRKYDKIQKAVINDSFKLLPFSAEKIAKDFDLDTVKGSIDYTMYRPMGYEPTPEEWSYIQNDCYIIAKALRFFLDKSLTKMTIGSNALNFYKQLLGRKRFEYLYPVLNNVIDSDIRMSYRGGFVYVDPRRAGKDLENVISYDVNSLYPSVMYNDLLPYGDPIYFKGQPKPYRGYPLYILFFKCSFEIKPDHIPCLQLKNNSRFCPTDYITSSKGEIIQLCMTSVDFELFTSQYDLMNYEPLEGFYFKGARRLFKNYIDYWYDIKQNASGAIRALAKLMLNNLYGKFATNPLKAYKVPTLEGNRVVYHAGEEQEGNPIYTVMGCFITAYARKKTITTAQALYPYFVYADTDSVHLVGITDDEVKKVIQVDDKKLGFWKFEGTAEKARFLRVKTYEKLKNGKLSVTCAGMPTAVKNTLKYNEFKTGACFNGKLTAKIVEGGTLLCETTFKIH